MNNGTGFPAMSHPASVVAWQEMNKRMPQFPDTTLFHYTSLHGLYGILTSGALWASDSEFLNDPTEIRYARGVIEDVMMQELPAIGDSQEFLRVQVLSSFDVSDQADVFVISYSERADILRQWIAYTPDACGVSIGFRSSFFRDQMTRRVLYARKQQEALIRHALATYSNAYAMTRNADDRDDQLLQLGDDLALLIHWYGLYFKDPSFADEREWRTVKYEFRDQHVPHCRVTASALVPYVKILLRGDEGVQPQPYPIVRVILGPGLDRRNIKSITSFVAQYAEKAEVLPSAVPFRKVR